VSAVRKGQPVDAVAAEEGLSESEIRLHLGLGGLPTTATKGEHGSVRV
jgi:hypothetical protein